MIQEIFELLTYYSSKVSGLLHSIFIIEYHAKFNAQAKILYCIFQLWQMFQKFCPKVFRQKKGGVLMDNPIVAKKKFFFLLL
jgi:hypothetical protein